MTLASLAFVTAGVSVVAQVAATNAAGDPMQALWSLLGSSPFAAVCWLWIKDLKAQRDTAQTNERAMVSQLAKFIETDADWKATVREPLRKALGGP